jgi:hypothetical protein
MSHKFTSLYLACTENTCIYDNVSTVRTIHVPFDPRSQTLAMESMIAI